MGRIIVAGAGLPSGNGVRAVLTSLVVLVLIAGSLAFLPLPVSASNDLYAQPVGVSPLTVSQSQRNVPLLGIMLNTTGPMPVMVFGMFISYTGMDPMDIERLVIVRDMNMNLVNDTGDMVLDNIPFPFFPQPVNVNIPVMPGWWEQLLILVDIAPTATVGNIVSVEVTNPFDIMADQPVNGMFPLMSFFGTFIEANHVPTANIISPVNGENFLVGETVSAQGFIHDDEDGGLAGYWSSNLDGYLGLGNLTTLTLTTQGLHTLTFNATDRCGAGIFAFVDVYYSRARFNGSWKDEGVDLNGDGMFEYLRVLAGVECALSFRATVQGELRDPLGMMPITQLPLAFPPEEFQVDAGSQWVAFDFWGFDIYEFGPYPSYRCMNMRLLDAMTWQTQDEELDPYNVTTPYDFDDFQRPPRFTGAYGHRLVDDDSDGKWDWLVMEAVVNASLPGAHSWLGELHTEGGVYIDYYETAWGGVMLPVGETTVDFWFDGRLVWNHCDNFGYSGNFTLSNLQMDEWLTRVNAPTPRDAVAESGYMVEVLSASDFERAPFFTGTYADYGVDDNGDGAFDWLCIDVEVNVSEEMDYQISGSLRVNGTAVYVGYANNITHLAPGVHIITLWFRGYDIFKTGLSGARFDLTYIGIYIMPSFQVFDYTLLAYTTGVYDYSQFQAPPFFVVRDSFADSGWDEDGDGDFDWLNVTFQVTVSVEGNYEVYVDRLRTSSGTTVEYSVGKVEHLLPGTHLVTLQFDGMRIHELGNVGMYQLYDVQLYDEMDVERDPGSGASNYYWWTNAVYDRALFQPGSFFTGAYGSHGKDVDGNALFEYLCADIGLNVTSSGTWVVSATLVNSTGWAISSASETTYLTEGVHTYQLDFAGFDIEGFGQPSPYFLSDMSVYRASDWLQTDYVSGPIPITDPPSYLPGDFAVGSRFTGNFTHSAVDGDGDGLAELLRIGVEVEVTEDGQYQVGGDLQDGSGFVLAWGLTFDGWLDAGTHWVTLEVPGYDIWRTGAVQNLTLTPLVLYREMTMQDWLVPAYTFGPLNWSHFVPMPYLTGNIASHGTDMSGDWHYEYLTVEVEFNATAPGLYNFNIQMQNGDGTWFNSWTEMELDAGLQWVAVQFPGGQFFDSGYNGTYAVTTVNANDFFGIYWENLATTADTDWYNYTDFAPPSFFTGVISDHGEDLNMNGLYDELVIEVEVDLSYPGNFILQANIYTYPGGDYITWATVEDSMPAGIQTVEFRFDGYDLYETGWSGKFEVRYLSLSDEWWNLLNTYYGSYLTAWYGNGEWEQVPRAGMPDAPEDLTISLAAGEISLDWLCDDPDVSRFNVYRSEDPYSFNLAVPYDTTTLTTWTDPEAGIGADMDDYYYLVRSEDVYGNEDGNYLRVGKYPIALAAGWSLVSLPLSQQGGVADSLASISGMYSSVQLYDGSVSEWLTYSPDAPDWLNSLQSLDDAQAFWISTTAACTLVVFGEVPSETTLTLHKGWNMVGWPSANVTRTVGNALAGLPWDMVQGSGMGPYNLVDYGAGDVWTPGTGLWIHVTADCTMEIDW